MGDSVSYLDNLLLKDEVIKRESNFWSRHK